MDEAADDGAAVRRHHLHHPEDQAAPQAGGLVPQALLHPPDRRGAGECPGRVGCMPLYLYLKYPGQKGTESARRSDYRCSRARFRRRTLVSRRLRRVTSRASLAPAEDAAERTC